MSANGLARYVVASILAYGFVLQLLFPLHFSTAAHHADMYMQMYPVAVPADPALFGPGAYDLRSILSCPRPVTWLIASFLAELPFEGPLALYAAIWIFNLAIALFLVERIFLRAKLHFALLLLTLAFAYSAPAFYFSHTYDSAHAFATFFGLLAIFLFEHGTRRTRSLILPAFFCLLSALSKETFTPVLILYGLTRAVWFPPPDTSRRTRIWIALTPLMIAAGALAHSLAVQSEFIQFAGSKLSHPYRVDYRPSSILAAAKFYIWPLVRPSTVVLVILVLVMAWAQRRLRLAALVIIAALLLYAPYLLLPNHLLGYYAWMGVPLLILLIPVAIAGQPREEPRPAVRLPFFQPVQLIAPWLIALALIFAIRDFQHSNRRGSEWVLLQERTNKNLLASLRSLQPQLAKARSLLVFGLTATFHPWQHPDFLRRELGFRGTSFLVSQGPSTAEGAPGPVRHVGVGNINWHAHDLCLVFNDLGELSAIYPRASLLRVWSRFPLDQEDLTFLVGNPELFALTEAFDPAAVRAEEQSVAIGRGLQQGGRIKAALHFLDIALHRNEQNAYAHFYRGVCLEALADHQAALLHYRRAVELDAGSPARDASFTAALTRAEQRQ